MQNRPGSCLELDVVPPLSSLPSNPHKGPKSPSAFEPVFQKERPVQWRGFSYYFVLLKGGEREGEIKGGKAALEPNFPSCSKLLRFLPALSHLLEEKANFWKNS